MSLVGTRPPTVDEWDKYELHHRARLATKPGLTGMWQVSGRSNITDLKSLMLLGVDLSLLQSVTGMTFFSHSLNGVCWFLSCIFVCYIVMAFVIKKIDNIRSKREAEVCFLQMYLQSKNYTDVNIRTSKVPIRY